MGSNLQVEYCYSLTCGCYNLPSYKCTILQATQKLFFVLITFSSQSAHVFCGCRLIVCNRSIFEVISYDLHGSSVFINLKKLHINLEKFETVECLHVVPRDV